MSAPHPSAPPALRALLLQAQGLLERRSWQDAGQVLERARALAPADAEVARLTTLRALMLGDAALAVAEAQRACKLAAERADLWMLLGRAHKLAGELEAAIDAYREAVTRSPALAEAHVSLGIALKAAGRLDEAVQAQRRALQANPRLAVAHVNLANSLALLSRERGDAATASDLEAQALAAIEQARALAPDDESILNAWVGVHHQLDRHESALAPLLQWIARHPEAGAAALTRVALTLLHLGRQAEAFDWARRAQARGPESAELLSALGSLLLHRLEQQEGLELLTRAADLPAPDPAAGPTLAIGSLYLHDDPAQIAAVHAKAAALLKPQPTGEAPALGQPQPKQRLRVGYLSGDLRRHSVAYFIESLWARHDPARVEVWAYHNHRVHDEVSERLKAQVAQWRPCAGLSDEALWRLIRSDQIDVLIDLSGWTHHGRPEVLAWRAAPLQIAFLGYPTASAIPNIDFRISDAVIDPPDSAPGDAVLRCAPSMFCYRPDTELAVGEPPCLRQGFITFGSFNNIPKWSPATLALWAEVLHAVPGSRLMVKTRALQDPGLREQVVQRFAALGIGTDRLQLEAHRDDLSHHLALYRDIDIALDCFPYNGATTTLEALWSGVPVIKLAGRSAAARMGAS
ncbi:MAG: tetratricopeptide repeat protein, partial [Burkholderiaceae bacterium]|nr:tetratricopeptide repeat protein [Burkholderiaceae bacterium]